MTDYGFGSNGVPKVELKSTRKPVEPDKIQRAVEEGEELGFVPRSPSKKTTKRQSSDTAPVPTSGRRRKKTEPQGKILITGPERVMQRFRDLCDDRDLPYWKVLEELLSE
ncbi:hypothetical protein [Tritonibacter mobilis]|uniref:hypothetical protein n=1 Tax=Tritonibacter mobilis TaxID=379347 RepID=UPI0013A554AC|nr:hypothetical protein [Tritonibacter mobilis]